MSVYLLIDDSLCTLVSRMPKAISWPSRWSSLSVPHRRVRPLQASDHVPPRLPPPRCTHIQISSAANTATNTTAITRPATAPWARPDVAALDASPVLVTPAVLEAGPVIPLTAGLDDQPEKEEEEEGEEEEEEEEEGTGEGEGEECGEEEEEDELSVQGR